MSLSETANSEATGFRKHKKLDARQRQILFGLWKEISPNFEFEPDESEAQPERAARLRYANDKLGFHVTSWNGLSRSAAGKLIAAMRADLGRRNLPSRAQKMILALAVELWPEHWDAALRDRIGVRFRVGKVEDLTPSDAHALIDELLSRIARRDLQIAYGTASPRLQEKIAELRERFSR